MLTNELNDIKKQNPKEIYKVPVVFFDDKTILLNQNINIKRENSALKKKKYIIKR